VGVSVKKGGERSESGFAPNGLQTPDSGLQTSFMDTGHLAKQRVKLNGLLNLAVSVQTGGATAVVEDHLSIGVSKTDKGNHCYGIPGARRRHRISPSANRFAQQED